MRLRSHLHIDASFELARNHLLSDTSPCLRTYVRRNAESSIYLPKRRSATLLRRKSVHTARIHKNMHQKESWKTISIDFEGNPAVALRLRSKADRISNLQLAAAAKMRIEALILLHGEMWEFKATNTSEPVLLPSHRFAPAFALK